MRVEGVQWALEIEVGGKEDGLLMTATHLKRTAFRLSRERGVLVVCIPTIWQADTAHPGSRPRFEFELNGPETAAKLRVEWRHYAVRLYADGELFDEEWPLGEPDTGEWELELCQGTRCALCDSLPEAASDETALEGPAQLYSAPGEDTAVGDCMPFFRDGRFCLYYLLDRRAGASKAHLGAHQWAQISSADLKRWTVHPLAIPISTQWEGSILSGSLIQHGGLTYAFYTVLAADGSGAKLTYAISRDGVRFEKSGCYFTLKAPYDPACVCGPMVFMDDGGLYHMLVSTRIRAQARFGGCLAHLTSENLTQWCQQLPFLKPGYDDVPDCSDYFYWNGWYYLVFSIKGIGRYRMSRTPMGPWLRPGWDVLDTLDGQMPKTAPFHERRLVVSDLPRYQRAVAGCAVIHELFQRPDGTLGTRFVPEVMPKPLRSLHPADAAAESPWGRGESTLFETREPLRLRARVRCEPGTALYGMVLRFDEGREYVIEMDPFQQQMRLYRPDQHGTKVELCASVHQPDTEFSMDLMVWGDVMDISLSNGRAAVLRLPGDEGAVQACLFAQNGRADMADMALCELEPRPD